jgi:hypothetical protein
MQVVLYRVNITVFDKIINCILMILSKKLSWLNKTIMRSTCKDFILLCVFIAKRENACGIRSVVRALVRSGGMPRMRERAYNFSVHRVYIIHRIRVGRDARTVLYKSLSTQTTQPSRNPQKTEI